MTIKYRAGYKYQLAEAYSCMTPIKPDKAVRHVGYSGLDLAARRADAPACARVGVRNVAQQPWIKELR